MNWFLFSLDFYNLESLILLITSQGNTNCSLSSQCVDNGPGNFLCVCKPNFHGYKCLFEVFQFFNFYNFETQKKIFVLLRFKGNISFDCIYSCSLFVYCVVKRLYVAHSTTSCQKRLKNVCKINIRFDFFFFLWSLLFNFISNWLYFKYSFLLFFKQIFFNI